jgi:hypothetical protein
MKEARMRGGAVGVMAMAAVAVLGCDSFMESYNRSFKESFVREFNASCVKSGVAKGAAEATMTPICACMGKHLVDHNSVGVLQKLTDQDAPESKKAINEALAACGVNKK